jgi:outer membrane lipoprotein-sorting protein
MNDDERQFEDFVSNIKFDDTPDLSHRDKLEQDLLDALTKQPRQQERTLKIWRTIIKSRITKLAAAAMIVITVLVVISQLGGSSVVWADVLENIRNSKTLTFLIRTKEQELPIMKAMVIEPYLLRFEFLSEQVPDAPILGGQIWIVDTGKAKALILNTVKKTCKVCPADKEMLRIYDTFRNFRDREDFTVEEIDRRQIGDKQAIGFKLKKEHGNHEIIVWADLETKLPILMEETYENKVGQIMQHIVTDIVFDAELDVSLFSLKQPEGYRLEKFDYDAAVMRVMSATNMDRILKACRKYVSEHGGRWPDSLQELAKYGLTKDILTNPRQPSRELGYVYLKPPASPLDSRIVLYEAYDIWNGGINVGFANYHVQFIKKEPEFKKRLKESPSGK